MAQQPAAQQSAAQPIQEENHIQENKENIPIDIDNDQDMRGSTALQEKNIAEPLQP